MIDFNVSVMSCGHCVSAVTKAIQSLDPQARVDVDLASHTVHVESTKGREDLASALAEAGYAPD